jgi:hypothetical protein
MADRYCDQLGLEPVKVISSDDAKPGPGLGLDAEGRVLTLTRWSSRTSTEMRAQVFGSLVGEAFPDSGHASRALVAAACIGLGLCGFAVGWVRSLVSGHGYWISGAVLPVGYVCVMALLEFRRHSITGDAHRRRVEVMRLAGDDAAVLATYLQLCPPPKAGFFQSRAGRVAVAKPAADKVS